MRRAKNNKGKSLIDFNRKKCISKIIRLKLSQTNRYLKT